MKKIFQNLPKHGIVIDDQNRSHFTLFPLVEESELFLPLLAESEMVYGLHPVFSEEDAFL
jgi:hypothetical protein